MEHSTPTSARLNLMPPKTGKTVETVETAVPLTQQAAKTGKGKKKEKKKKKQERQSSPSQIPGQINHDGWSASKILNYFSPEYLTKLEMAILI